MRELYVLLHKDIELAVITIEGDDILKVQYSNDKSALRHLPVGYAKDLRKWLHSRIVPAARYAIQNKDSTQTPFRYMLSNYGLSLTDAYWIRPSKSNYTWKSINLYTNAFRDTTELELQSSIIDGRGINFTPSGTLNGDLRKKWLISKNGQRILVKGNYSNSCIQAISEVFATEIYKKQPYEIAYTPYEFIKLKASGKEILGCACPAYTSESLEFVSAYDLLLEYNKPKTMNTFQFYKQLVYKLTGQNVDNYYDMMLMTDFVITNTDRHFNNFGVLRNPDTLQYVCPAPIYDSGNSLFYKQDYVPVGKALLEIEVTSFKSIEVELLKEVKQRTLFDTKCLPTTDCLNNLLLKDELMPEQRRERILKAYERKIEYLRDFQNGADLWEREYRK